MKKGISKQQLPSNVLYIDKLQQGFEDYYYIILQGELECYTKFIHLILNLSNGENFFDFYYPNLDFNAKQNVLDYLLKNGLDLNKFMNFEVDNIFFNIKDFYNILNLILKISFDEVLFSTFYFTNPTCTLWTNYEKKFILFIKDTSQKNILFKVINKAKLNIIGEK